MLRFRLVMWLTVLSLFGLLAFGCGDDKADAIAVGLGPQGGTVEAEGVVLVIPAGALESDTAIRIQPVDAPPEDEWLALGSFVRIEPSGLALAKAATLTMPASEALLPAGRSFDDASLITGAELSSRFEAVESQRDGDRFSASIGTFAIFGVAIPVEASPSDE